MLVRSAMQTHTVTIDAQDALPKAVTMMQTLGVRRLLVLSGGTLVGLLTDGEVQRALPPMSDQRTPWEFLCLAGRLQVGEIMRRDLFTARPDDDLRRAITTMLERHVSGLPVQYEDGTLVGILTLTDVLRAAVQPVPGAGLLSAGLPDWEAPDWDRSDWDTAKLGTVREHMSTGAVTVSPDMPLAEAAAWLIVTRLRVLPVTQGRTLLGVLHQQDIRAAVDHQLVAHGSVLHGPGLMEHRFFLQGKTVRDLMCPPGAEVSVDAPLPEAMRAMLKADVHGLPVVDAGSHEFLGVITISDILRALLTGSQPLGTQPSDGAGEAADPATAPATPTPTVPASTGDTR